MELSEYARLYQLEESLWWFVGMRRLVDTLLGERARPGLRCLDAGCGAGFNAVDFERRYGWQVFPMDYVDAALKFSAQRGLARLARADTARLPYAGASFDCITSMDVLVMLSREDGRSAWREFHRVLKPGGFAMVRVAALELLRGDHSRLNREVHRYRLRELAGDARAAGFRIERATYANSLLLPAALLKRRVLEPLRLIPCESDVRPVAPWLDRFFLSALRVENALLRAGVPLPPGVSAMVLAVKP